MGNPRYADWTGRVRLRRALESSDAPCWICGMPIPRGVHHRHPYAMELDELTPISRGGSATDPANVRRAHRCCNQWRGDRPVSEVERIAAAVLAAFGRWSCPSEFVVFARSAPKGATPERRREGVETSREW